MAMLPLPDSFKQNILSLFPEEAGYFFEALSKPSTASIRVNSQKQHPTIDSQLQVEWCANGQYLTERFSFIEDPIWHAGAYYVQESSSMFLHHVVSQLPLKKAGYVTLDLCAAPGGKSTLLLDALSPNSLLVANEIIKSRVGVLQENITRWGAANVLVTNNDPKNFLKLGAFFDLIVIDAPCSGEGLWRRDSNAINEWSMENVHICEARQSRILQDILPCLKPGGFLVYSTCTYNELENEQQVEKVIKNFGLNPFPIEVPLNWPIVQKEGFQFRFLPHKVKGEGLYMAVLQKPEEMSLSKSNAKRVPLNFVSRKVIPSLHPWLDQPESFDYFIENDFVFAFPLNSIEPYEFLRSNLYIKQTGICMGKFDKGGKLIPEHSLALSVNLNKDIPKVELDLTQAHNYLKKGQIAWDESMPLGWCLACFKGQALGWMKVLPNRVNNYFPAEYRIIKDLE
jgi:16S rRNA C967 or C1407 C5-methylase (RsmB/RsmF family)/NOL1/NOP2/fmu family ribosome biogenesis protein